MFIPSLTAMIGYWATLSLNMPDFTRFGRSQREQIVGQVVALPTTMAVFAAMGVLITSATVVIYGEAIWDPVKLVARFDTPLVVAISMFTAVVATLAVNIAANVVSPANDFANAFPRLIDFKTGGLITGLLAILMQPWKLLADPSGYIFTWLLGYSGGLGSIAGVLIADYWIVRRTAVRLEDLYLTDGRVSVLERMERRGRRRHRRRLRARVGRPGRSGAEAALRLRVVRRVCGGVWRLRDGDGAGELVVVSGFSRTWTGPPEGGHYDDLLTRWPSYRCRRRGRAWPDARMTRPGRSSSSRC